jgi:hypothetical protein
VADGAGQGSVPGDIGLGRVRHGFSARVASYVWNQYLMFKPGGNRLYFIPDANHYLQIDRPDAFVKVLLHALKPPGGQAPGVLEAGTRRSLLVDTSREPLRPP